MATTHRAQVVEHLQSGGYSYIKVQEAKETYWIAMTQRQVKNGEMIAFNEQGWMQDFHSKTLNRTFKKILFASDVVMPSATQEHVVTKDVMQSPYQQRSTISIAQLFKERQKYAGQRVSVRAKVTKTSAQIMKRNWVHLQDGSQFQGFDDLVFTTSGDMPEVGDVVTATGIVVIDKDFGYGYFYKLLVEETSFTKK